MPLLSRLTREEDLRRSKGEPYRLLEAVPALSHGDPATENMLIQCEATGAAWHFSHLSIGETLTSLHGDVRAMSELLGV